MQVDRWKRIDEIVQSALELDTGALPDYLDRACAGDEELRAEVASLMEMRAEAAGFLEVKAIDLVAAGMAKDEKTLGLAVSGQSLNSEQHSLIGRKLGDFIINEKLGEGGFGAIYRASQPVLDREAAIKIINEDGSRHPHYKERFTREAQLASRLEHPYTASIYAFGVEPDGLIWIAMEFVRGEPLNSLLKNQGPLSLERFVPFFNKICEVVQTAHESGIIHRDLKPANIMVISRAGRLLPKLLDFGIAKSLAVKEEPSTSTESIPAASAAALERVSDRSFGRVRREDDTSTDNFIVGNAPAALSAMGSMRQTTPLSNWTIGVGGSPHYMAPEQWQYNSSITARADIYALGVLCYEALTGRKPFQGDADALRKAHLESEIPTLGDSIPAEIVRAIDKVVARAMAKRPEDRFASTIEFAAALQDAAGIVDDQLGLISLDNRLHENLLTSAPQPIAEAVANLDTARNLYQAREQIVEVVRASVRYLGIVALACRAATANQDYHDNEPALLLLRKLRRDHLDEKEWLELARELSRPFALQRENYPIPELISFFFEPNSEKLYEQIERLAPLLKLSQVRIAAGSNDQLRSLLNQMMLHLATLLRAISFLSNYQLVVPYSGYCEVWMGNRLRRIFAGLKGKPAIRQPLLVKAEGDIILSLSPFALVAEPTLGAREELFLLEGNSYQKAKLVALPTSFEHTNKELWSWFDKLFELGDHSGLEEVIEQTPYPGLHAFDAKDAAIFFGREEETKYFLNRLRIQPMLVLVGPSGAGKSSFIQAGVVPHLENCRAITVRPGVTPLATLSAKLIHEGIGETDLRAELVGDPLALANRLQAAAARDNCQIVLIIDQLEELFTLCQHQQERELYARMLTIAASAAEDPVRVIFTLRDDFLVRARALPALGEKLAQGLELLTTPGLDNLVRILVEPARRAGYQFEDKQLPVEMAAAVVDRPMALPLLAFSAAKLWELRDRQSHQIKRETYQQLGGVGGALAKHAEELLNQMLPRERKYVREAFRQLVTNEGTRAVLARAELEQLLGREAQVMLEKLLAARLLTTYEREDGIESIEVAHESLLTAWPRLVKWQQEDAEGARLRDQLREAARQWHERGEPKGLLWRDEALSELKLWQSRYAGKLTECELAFTNMSFAEAKLSQRKRRLLYGAALAILLTALTTVFWINQETQNQLLESYLDQGRQELVSGRPMQAAVYFSEVYNQGKDGAALRLLLGQAMRSVDVAQIATFRSLGGINQAVFSPDGKRVITAGDDYTLKVWEVTTNQLIFSFHHSDEVLGASFSHNGKLIGTASRDRTARIWDAETGNLISTFTGHKSPLRTISFSPDDRLIVTTSEDFTAKIWDLQSGRLLFTIETPERFLSASFSPDGTRILTSGYDNAAKLWDAANGQLLLSIEGHTGRIRTAVFSHDGTKIATASDDRTAKIWNAANGKLLASLEGNRAELLSIAFSADGQMIVASSGKMVMLWNAENYRLLTSLELHTSYIWSVEFNKDATQVLTASYDGTAKVWDVSKFKLSDAEIIRYPIGAAAAEYSRDGRLILTGGGGNLINLFDAQSKKLLRTIKLSDQRFKYIIARFSPDGRRIVTTNYYGADSLNTNADGVSLDKIARVWDTESGKLLLTLTGHQADIINVAFSADGHRIVTASFDKTAKVWDADTGALQLTLIGHTNDVRAAEFSPNGRKIVTASKDGSAKLWDAANGKLLGTLTGHSMALVYATFSPDGSRVVSASTDATIKITDCNSGQVLFSLNGHTGDCRYCVYSPDGSLIATTSADGTAKVWNAATGKLIISLEGHKEWLNITNFSPDQQHLITAGNDGAITTWTLSQETRTPAEITKLIEQRVPYRFERGQLIPVLNKPYTN